MAIYEINRLMDMDEKQKMRVVIIGGVAGGASAAARARRLSEDAEITVIERGPDVSFANCGLPYFLGGEIADRGKLSLQTPASLAGMLNVTVRTETEALEIVRGTKEVHIRHTGSGVEELLGYDKLIMSPGARPIRPPLPGIDDERIHTLRTLQDMDRIKAAADGAERVVIIGAGFIGLEVAEQMVRLGKKVTVVELVDQVLPQVDPEMARFVEDALRENGVELILGDGIAGFASGASGLTAELASGRKLEADVAVLSIGVVPESSLAEGCGLELGGRGAIVVNEFQQTSDPDIYAVGDVVETEDRVEEARIVLPLGGPANRQGRTAADHIFLDAQAMPYPGSIGTSIVRVFEIAAGVTGWTEKRLTQAGRSYGTTTVNDFHHASYYPGAMPLTVKVIWDAESGRLLGGQVVGAEGVDKRLDVLATAIAGRMDVEDLVHLELAYAPPFGSARDVVNTAGFSAQNQRLNLVRAVSAIPEGAQVVDVRPPVMTEADPMPGAIEIPFGQLRKRAGELDRDRPVVALCAFGKTSYFAARILSQMGFEAVSLTGGMRVLTGSKVYPGNIPKKG